MRPVEISLLLANLPVLLWGVVSRWSKPAWFTAFPMLALALLFAHLRWEGWRPQMIPAYFVTGWLALAAFSPLLHTHATRLPFRLRALLSDLLGLALISLAGLLSFLLPVFRFPDPTGPYRVGTITLHLTDLSRRETFSKNPGDHRELMVQLWYPAEPAPGTKPDDYLSNLDGPDAARLKRTFVPRFTQLDRVQTHSFRDAPLSQARSPFPILIFSPSWSGSRNQNTFQVEELASHGFVVAGIDHPYCTGITVFPDGRVILSDPSLDLDFSTDEAVQRYLRTAEEQARLRAQDARFVLDQLEKLNAADPSNRFTGRLAATRAGIFGHSFGGTVAAEACWLDRRFQAGLNMDGMLFGDAVGARVAQPFMFMNDDESPPTAAQIARSSYAKLNARGFQVQDDYLKLNGGYNLTIRKSKHVNFCDTPLFSPFRRLTGAGAINPRRCFRIVNDYSLAFFKKYLVDTAPPLLNGPSPDHPEVKFQKYGK